MAPPLFSFYTFLSAPADDARSDDVPEGRLNGDRETLDEMDESRKEEKNGFKAKFMFNIADGGFTGKSLLKLAELAKQILLCDGGITDSFTQSFISWLQ